MSKTERTPGDVSEFGVELRLFDEAELVRRIGLRLLIAKFAARCAGGALCPIEEKSK